MYPYSKYIIVSLLRGRTPKAILGSLRATGLSNSVDMDLFKGFMKDKAVKTDIGVISKMRTLEDVMENVEVLAKYEVKDFIIAVTTANEVWTQCWDMMSIGKYQRFIVSLLTAGYDLESILKEFNGKFSTNYTEASLAFFRDYYWDMRKLSGVQRVSACENIKDDVLRNSVLKIVDGDKHAGLDLVDSKRLPQYDSILSEILADAYVNYRKFSKKKDPDSRAALKLWLDVIVKIGDRHVKATPKNTDELDDLINKLQIDKKEKEAIPSITEFLKENKLA